jgi:hypothetical protein
MNRLREYIYLASFSAGVVFGEYAILQRLGGVFVAVAGVCALAMIAGALYRAPEGEGRANGLPIRQRKRPSSFASALRPQRQMRPGWT